VRRARGSGSESVLRGSEIIKVRVRKVSGNAVEEAKASR